MRGPVGIGRGLVFQPCRCSSEPPKGRSLRPTAVQVQEAESSEAPTWQRAPRYTPVQRADAPPQRLTLPAERPLGSWEAYRDPLIETIDEPTHADPNPQSEDRIDPEHLPQFVRFFRHASPYIEGHRGRTFVVVIPGAVIARQRLYYALLEDLTVLYGLGIKLVLVLGASQQIDAQLLKRGLEPNYKNGYRITDADAMLAVMEAAGATRTEMEANLSKALAVPMLRRHARSSVDSQQSVNYSPPVRIVSGNYVTGMRRGIVEGVDFGSTGKVRGVQVDAIQQQLDLGHVVLLSHLAYSVAGEVLNCNAYDVGTRAAIELQADKLLCLTLDEVAHLRLPQWLPLPEARQLLLEHITACRDDAGCNIDIANNTIGDKELQRVELDMDSWQALHFPSAVLAAVVSVKKGVKRAHLVDARVDGGLLLELYTRDGAGTMVSADFYEGIRAAGPQDLQAIQELLQPLQDAGIMAPRSRGQLLSELACFTVVERDSKVLACCLLHDLGSAEDGIHCGEVAAFCVHPSYRGTGRGDSLLDYVEQIARQQGIERLMLLTTRTADWFQQRAFTLEGPAHSSSLLPPDRRERVNKARNSRLYTKRLHQLDEIERQSPAGRRIGF